MIVVGDEANARKLITSALESYEARVTAFASAEEALKRLLDISPIRLIIFLFGVWRLRSARRVTAPTSVFPGWGRVVSDC